MSFDKAFDLIVREMEGGEKITNHPHDPGGLTKWGVCKRAFPHLDIANLTEAQAKAIYKENYWDKVRGDEMPYPISLCMFDSAVNQGTDAAIKMMQKTIGVTVDGVFGAKTLEAMEKVFDQGATKMIVGFMKQRVSRYLSMNNQAEESFERGWINRVLDVTAVAVEELYG